MKKIYITPQSEAVRIKIEDIMEGQLTDSVGEEQFFDAKKNYDDSFDTEDDLWDYSTKKDIWG